MHEAGLGGQAAAGLESTWHRLQWAPGEMGGEGNDIAGLSDTFEWRILLVNNSRINTSYAKKER